MRGPGSTGVGMPGSAEVYRGVPGVYRGIHRGIHRVYTYLDPEISCFWPLRPAGPVLRAFSAGAGQKSVRKVSKDVP